MKRTIGLIITLLASAPLFSAGCSTSMRDAVISGAASFVSSTTSGTLSSLLPIADLLDPAGQ